MIDQAPSSWPIDDMPILSTFHNEGPGEDLHALVSKRSPLGPAVSLHAFLGRLMMSHHKKGGGPALSPTGSAGGAPTGCAYNMEGKGKGPKIFKTQELAKHQGLAPCIESPLSSRSLSQCVALNVCLHFLPMRIWVWTLETTTLQSL